MNFAELVSIALIPGLLENEHEEGERKYAPPMETGEDAECFFARFALPGVNPNDIKVTFENHKLLVTAVRKSSHGENAKLYHQHIHYGDLHGSSVLDRQHRVIASKIVAENFHGLLTVKIPKDLSEEKPSENNVSIAIQNVS